MGTRGRTSARATHTRTQARLRRSALIHFRLRLALAGRAAPLGRAALEVRSGESPGAVGASRGTNRRLGRHLAKRDDRATVPRFASVVERVVVVALVEGAGGGREPASDHASRSGSANRVSWRLPLSIRHASGSPVRAQAAGGT